MQSGRGLVEDEKISNRELWILDCRIVIRGMAEFFRFAKMTDHLQSLRFTAGQRVERLAKPQITDSDFLQDAERLRQCLLFADLSEELNRFAHGQPEQIMYRFAVQSDF